MCALLLAVLASGADAKRPPAIPSTGLAPIAYDKPAPDFIYDEGSGSKKLSDARGAPVLVHFWDSWCHPCTDELPLLVRARSAAPDLVVITFSDEENDAARAYLAKQGIDLPVVADTARKVFTLYGVHAIPVSVFLRGDGTVQHVSVGEMDWKEIAEALSSLGASLTPRAAGDTLKAGTPGD